MLRSRPGTSLRTFATILAIGAIPLASAPRSANASPPPEHELLLHTPPAAQPQNDPLGDQASPTRRQPPPRQTTPQRRQPPPRQTTPQRRQPAPRNAPPQRGTSREEQRRAQQPQQRRGNTRRAPARAACPRMVDTPINISAGPVAHLITGPVLQDQIAHSGLRLNAYGVMTEETMRANWHCFPAKYKKLLRRPQEVRVKPIVVNLIPRELIISPKIRDTGIYGIAWNLFSLGIAPISGPVRLSFDFGLPVKYMYIYSDTLSSPTHFLRPGLEGKVELEFAITERFLVSTGWASQLYIPQRVGGSLLDFGDVDSLFSDSIWHIGQAFLNFHIRVPYQTAMPR